jgi:hypothetical protein
MQELLTTLNGFVKIYKNQNQNIFIDIEFNHVRYLFASDKIQNIDIFLYHIVPSRQIAHKQLRKIDFHNNHILLSNIFIISIKARSGEKEIFCHLCTYSKQTS